jgi:hypothetical protein
LQPVALFIEEGESADRVLSAILRKVGLQLSSRLKTASRAEIVSASAIYGRRVLRNGPRSVAQFVAQNHQ